MARWLWQQGSCTMMMMMMMTTITMTVEGVALKTEAEISRTKRSESSEAEWSVWFNSDRPWDGEGDFETTDNIQGRACKDWVNEEFSRLRATVHTLSADSSSTPQQPTTDNAAPMLVCRPTDEYSEGAVTQVGPLSTHRPVNPEPGLPTPQTRETSPLSLPLTAEVSPSPSLSTPRRVPPATNASSTCAPRTPLSPSPLPSTLPLPSVNNESEEQHSTESDPVTENDSNTIPTPSVDDCPTVKNHSTEPPSPIIPDSKATVENNGTMTDITVEGNSTKTDSNTTVYNNKSTTETDKVTSTDMTENNNLVTETAVTESDMTLADNSSVNGGTCVKTDNSSSHCSCCHDDCVPKAEFERITQSLSDEISALRASLQETRQTCKIDIDALTTHIKHMTTTASDKTTSSRASTNYTKKTKPKTQTHPSASRHKTLYSPPPPLPPSPSFPAADDCVPLPDNAPPACEKSPSTCDKSPPQIVNPSPPHVPLNPPPKVCIAKDTSVLLLSDSSLRSINIPRPAAQAECINGLTVLSLTQWLTRQSPAHTVRQVTFHVGASDCCGLSTTETADGVSTQQWRALITQCQHVFPKAQLQASSIIPARGRNPLNSIIRPSNDHLHEACQALGVHYVDHRATFTTQSGAPRLALYNNAIHPSRKGTERVALNLFPPKRPLLSTPPPRHTSRVPSTRHSKAPLFPPARSPLLPPPLTHSDFPDLPSKYPRPVHSPTPSSASHPSPSALSTQVRTEGERHVVPVPGDLPDNQSSKASQRLPQPGVMFGEGYPPPPPTWHYGRYVPPPPPPPQPVVPYGYPPRPIFPPHHPWYWPYVMPPPYGTPLQHPAATPRL